MGYTPWSGGKPAVQRLERVSPRTLPLACTRGPACAAAHAAGPLCWKPGPPGYALGDGVNVATGDVGATAAAACCCAGGCCWPKAASG